ADGVVNYSGPPAVTRLSPARHGVNFFAARSPPWRIASIRRLRESHSLLHSGFQPPGSPLKTATDSPTVHAQSTATSRCTRRPAHTTHSHQFPSTHQI